MDKKESQQDLTEKIFWKRPRQRERETERKCKTNICIKSQKEDRVADSCILELKKMKGKNWSNNLKVGKQDGHLANQGKHKPKKPKKAKNQKSRASLAHMLKDREYP